jgi:hypothetical protein
MNMILYHLYQASWNATSLRWREAQVREEIYKKDLKDTETSAHRAGSHALNGTTVTVDDQTRPIRPTKAARNKIGLLPVDLVGKVAVFYSELSGVFQDFRNTLVGTNRRKEHRRKSPGNPG